MSIDWGQDSEERNTQDAIDNIPCAICTDYNIVCLFLQEFFAPLTVVADGCFSRFRKDTGKLKPETKSHFVGMLMEGCPQVLHNRPCT